MKNSEHETRNSKLQLKANMNQLIYLSATKLAQAIRAKKISSREAVDAYLTRIGEVNPNLTPLSNSYGKKHISIQHDLQPDGRASFRCPGRNLSRWTSDRYTNSCSTMARRGLLSCGRIPGGGARGIPTCHLLMQRAKKEEYRSAG